MLNGPVETSIAMAGLTKAKQLARRIKSLRCPSWPTLVTSDLPPRDVADRLVECYLGTIERVYRILHVPTFRKHYEKVWEPDGGRDLALLVQVKLVLALGALTLDDKFSMRAAAIQWIYEAQSWLSVPDMKSRLGIRFVQNNILLLVARELVAVGGDLTWISAGTLLRVAMHMGLQRDPDRLPSTSTFVAEMRRRLWNTIVELCVQASIGYGGAPLLSMDDFDTKPPANLDDEQLMLSDENRDAPPLPPTDARRTQMSVAVALRGTLPARLAIARQLNSHSSRISYDETLRLAVELRTAHREMARMLQASAATSTPGGWRANRFELQAVDYIIHRYFLALHVPFFEASLHEATYAFSRKVVVETSLKVWLAAWPPDFASASGAHKSAALDDSDEDVEGDETNAPAGPHALARLILCSGGFFRTSAIQATVAIAVELKAQLAEEDGLGPATLRPDLLAVMDGARAWSLRCVSAGETSIKGYLLSGLIAAQLRALVRGDAPEVLLAKMVRAAEEASETCLPILEAMLAAAELAGGSASGAGALDGADGDLLSGVSPAVTDDWDFTVGSRSVRSGRGSLC